VCVCVFVCVCACVCVRVSVCVRAYVLGRGIERVSVRYEPAGHVLRQGAIVAAAARLQMLAWHLPEGTVALTTARRRRAEAPKGTSANAYRKDSPSSLAVVYISSPARRSLHNCVYGCVCFREHARARVCVCVCVCLCVCPRAT
jgi:hypothetical protein